MILYFWPIDQLFRVGSKLNKQEKMNNNDTTPSLKTEEKEINTLNNKTTLKNELKYLKRKVLTISK